MSDVKILEDAMTLPVTKETIQELLTENETLTTAFNNLLSELYDVVEKRSTTGRPLMPSQFRTKLQMSLQNNGLDATIVEEAGVVKFKIVQL